MLLNTILNSKQFAKRQSVAAAVSFFNRSYLNYDDFEIEKRNCVLKNFKGAKRIFARFARVGICAGLEGRARRASCGTKRSGVE